MKEREKCKKWAITDLNAPNGSRDIPFQSQQFEQDGRSGVLASICLKFCRLLEVSKGSISNSLLWQLKRE